MGLLELCLLSMLAPQEPAAPKPAATVAATDPATWLPGDALAAVVWRATGGDAGVADLWERARALDPMGIAKKAQADFTRVLGGAGLDAEDLADLMHGGVAAALLGFTAQHQPRFVVVAWAPQRAARLQVAMERLAGANGAATATVAGHSCHRLNVDGQACYSGVFGNHLVFATDASTMAEVIAKTQRPSDASLAVAADYVAASAAADCGGPATLTVFVRPKRLFAVASGQES